VESSEWLFWAVRNRGANQMWLIDLCRTKLDLGLPACVETVSYETLSTGQPRRSGLASHPVVAYVGAEDVTTRVMHNLFYSGGS